MKPSGDVRYRVNSQFIHREVECNAARHRVPVLEVAEEAHTDVEAGDEDHAGVEDPVPASHLVRCPHLILQRQHNSDTLGGEKRLMVD